MLTLGGCSADSDSTSDNTPSTIIAESDDSFTASGHEVPAHSNEAREALALAHIELAHLEDQSCELTELIPICQVTGDLTSAESVFSVTKDEGGSYIAAFYDQDGCMVGAVDWGIGNRGEPGEWASFYGDFWMGFPEEDLVTDFGKAPDVIRYVETFYGIWVVGRVGDSERGMFVSHQGDYDCWPEEDRVYSGEEVINHLRHIAENHADNSGAACDDPTW